MRECVSKLDNCVLKGMSHMTPSMRSEIMKISNRLLNLSEKVK